MELIIGKIEPTEGLRKQVTEADWSESEGLSDNRRRERLSARALLRGALRSKNRILYNNGGAPYLEGSPLHISFSHSATMAAALIAERRCGVDIERLDRRYEVICSRFCTEREALLIEDRSLALPIIWAAKEAIYKLSGVEALELLHGITIESIAQGQIVAHTNTIEKITLQYSLDVENHVVVWGMVEA